jgi:HSP20 family protein
MKTLINRWTKDTQDPEVSENSRVQAWKPIVDVWEDEKAVHLTAEMPGVNKESLEVKVEDNRLVIRGAKQAEPGEWNSIYSERRRGEYIREFQMDDTINPEKISAELKDGILNLTLPKAEKVLPKTIEIN